jgi:transcriptional regulator with XRE-family HTH domain
VARPCLPPTSGSYAKGVRDNPTKRHLQALADFFDVPPSSFFDEDGARRVDSELELLAAMRDAGVRQVALRATGLSRTSLAAIASMIEHARQIEGLTPVTDDGAPPQ